MADETSGTRDVVSDLPDQRNPADRSDAELMNSIATGDRSAFAALYDRYSKRAYSLARRLCVSAEFAEDVVQESFLMLWRAPERYDPERGAFSTWLLTLVHHRSVDVIRRESTQRKRVDALADSAGPDLASAADVDALAHVENGYVYAALNNLSSEHKTILRLAYFGGYTQSEVAKLTGLPLGTVKSRTFTALRKLRIALSPLRNGVAT